MIISPHECDTPPTALPGHVWECPDCGRQHFAMEDDDGSDVDAAFFHWELIEEPLMVIRSAPVDPAKVGIDSNRCPFCGKVTRVWVYSKDYWIWVMERPPITEVFPYLSPGERETLITGVDDDCWNKYIKQPEDSE